ncbi:MAG: hypothetical protein A3F72_15160 [Bacteroidetes bacterium RIFCSPLOWO2_12_FULL_35_15]|nr:MAG: hypothetical protein A3F72_15160 [Bacteroidetes bacterium RIFCSPLOWO2_12_FULL_35_15]
MKKIFLKSAVLISLFVFAFSSCKNDSGTGGIGGKISVDEFEQKLKATENPQLVDVRTPGEYAEGRLEGAKNIDWNGDSFESEIQKLDKTKPTFVYCLSGGRSSSAADKMKELGFKEVYEMKGGIRAWLNANKPLVTDANSAPVSEGMSVTDFEAQLKTDKLVLVDFNAPWCAPCIRMAPMFEEVSTEMKDKLILLKINADENKALANAMKIESLPTILLYKNGTIVWKQEGEVEKSELLKIINQN